MDIGVLPDNSSMLQHFQLIWKVTTKCSFSKLVVATTSGSARFNHNKEIMVYIDLIRLYRKCTMFNFTEEVKSYIANSFPCKEKLKIFEELTNYNPYLVSLLAKNSRDSFKQDASDYILIFVVRGLMSCITGGALQKTR